MIKFSFGISYLNKEFNVLLLCAEIGIFKMFFFIEININI